MKKVVQWHVRKDSTLVSIHWMYLDTIPLIKAYIMKWSFLEMLIALKMIKLVLLKSRLVQK